MRLHLMNQADHFFVAAPWLGHVNDGRPQLQFLHRGATIIANESIQGITDLRKELGSTISKLIGCRAGPEFVTPKALVPDDSASEALDDIEIAGNVGAKGAVSIEYVRVIAIESEDALQKEDHFLKRRLAERQALCIESMDEFGDQRIPLPRDLQIETHGPYHIIIQV